jgi:hypothetical protein
MCNVNRVRFIHSFCMCLHCIGVDNEEKSPSLLASACRLCVIWRVVLIFFAELLCIQFQGHSFACLGSETLAYVCQILCLVQM